MAIPFSRTLSSLSATSSRNSLALLFVAIPILTAWCYWLFFVPVSLYSVSEKARVETQSKIQSIHAPLGGEVTSVRLENGLVVKGGEPLFALDDSDWQMALRGSKTKHQAILREQVSLQSELHVFTKGGDDEGGESVAELSAAQARLSAAVEHESFTRERLARFELLIQRGGVSELDFMEAKAEANKALAKRDEAESELARIEKSHDVKHSARLVAHQQLLAKIAHLDREKLTLDTHIERAEYEIARRVIRAPFDAVVGETRDMYVGLRVEEGERLGAFVPRGEIQVNAYFLPEYAFGRVRPGSVGRVTFDGFPWAQYGSATATVEHVAHEVRDGLVRVTLSVVLPSDSVIPLQHGMPVTAEVETERIVPAHLILRAAGKVARSD